MVLHGRTCWLLEGRVVARSVGLGIVGLGGAGRAHLRRVQAKRKSQVVAVYDPNQAALSQVADRLAGSAVGLATSDLEEFMAFSEIDGVSICSPDHWDLEHVMRTQERGWHVPCEKPLATTAEHCQRIGEAAQPA